jgi:hypothetical protein
MPSTRKTRRSGNLVKPIAGSSDVIREVHALRQQYETHRGQFMLSFGRLFHKALRAKELEAAWRAAGMSRRTAYNYMTVLDLHRKTNMAARKIGATDLQDLLKLAATS